MESFLRTYAAPGFDLQRTMDAAVVIPTVLRPALADSLRSVFAQDLPGRIHVLVGVDVPQGDLALLDRVCAAVPAHCAVQVLFPGYSTARRNGGLSESGEGGVLRTVLSYLANSFHVAYLDDDNWWAPDHLRTLRAAMAGAGPGGADWAYAQRWFVHPDTHRPVCRDIWESVGPAAGVFAQQFGGFVDTSCLMIDKRRCADAIPLWRIPTAGDARSMGCDRTVFEWLRHRRGAGSGQATVFYRMNAADGRHAWRVRQMGAQYAAHTLPPTLPKDAPCP